jgi:hypothetical protein
MAYFHVGVKFAGADTHKGDSVPVRLVHVRLDFKDEGGKIILHGVNQSDVRFPGQRCGCHF